MDKKAYVKFVESIETENVVKFEKLIQTISEKGDTIVLPHLAEKYSTTKNTEIKETIFNFFNDIKSKEAPESIAKLINQYDLNNETLLMLLKSCWGSGLDYSNNLDIFIELVYSKNFEIAFEAFTVIDSSLELIDKDEKNRLFKIVKSKKNTDESKANLCEKLVEILKD